VPPGSGKIGLSGGGARAPKRPFHHGLAEMPGEVRRLVEATLPTPGSVKGDRNDDVDACQQIGSLLAHQSGQRASQ
jgi:hypothetical protein